jgi:hypothetical protein
MTKLLVTAETLKGNTTSINIFMDAATLIEEEEQKGNKNELTFQRIIC